MSNSFSRPQDFQPLANNVVMSHEKNWRDRCDDPAGLVLNARARSGARNYLSELALWRQMLPRLRLPLLGSYRCVTPFNIFAAML